MFSLIPWKKRNKQKKGRELTLYKGHPLAELRDEFDALFDRFLSRWAESFRDLIPSRFGGLNVEDGDQEMVVRAEVPGFEPGEVDVQVSGNVLTVKAEKREEKKDKDDNGRYEERRYRTFYESVTLPPGTDPDKIEARYKNGLLEVHVPKSEGAKGKRIPVKA
jgi:HSP20 family protein